MTTDVVETIRVRHAPADVFELVSDVERYPDFIPYLTMLRVLERVPVEDGGEIFTAEALVRFKMAKERFVTRVAAHPENFTVHVGLIDGPFRKLENHWHITPLPDGSSQVDFSVSFEFANMFLGMLMRANKERAVAFLIDRFVAEAARRYPTVGNSEFGGLRTIHAEQ
ncbi:type II toxin-antitoxin system RatA family toxin [Hyphobacterium sp. HN65]|uniref:Type II toxin-antitoxin system RatA family toxin n=1 Tax=Hyphobacterium lacteum TaxID=3116575 RepID=A0ABU7LLY5_9PROT|nr:type II toxin-antitoxin system RatA family toxin [Hyphobacterium sp. HN65]MEE2524940.1 type II toxin-antitoxin system RatA family toxin [Hyphobacterium sp. HN65]